MASKILITVLRSICAYVLLLALGRLVGRKLLAHFTYFNFLFGVTLGSLAVRLSLVQDSTLLMDIIASVVLALLALLTELLNLKSVRIHTLFEGEAIVVISGGKILDGNLKKARMSISKLNMLLREKNFFNIADIEIAVIESDGELSVLPVGAKEPATSGDLNVTKPAATMPVDLIIDGRVLSHNLKSAGFDENWLKKQLLIQNKQAKDVFYAGLDTLGKLFITYRGQKNSPK